MEDFATVLSLGRAVFSMLCVTEKIALKADTGACENSTDLYSVGVSSPYSNVSTHPGQCGAEHGTSPSAHGSPSDFETL